MKTFSFRAECKGDAQRFQRELRFAGVKCTFRTEGEESFADVDVEIQTEASLEDLRVVLRCVPDGHAMMQTLRECSLKENSLDRDFNIY